jgi:site-specific DNA-adenine methylase
VFSYYGRKTKVVKYYPSPRYDTIIEPFAGSATYSLYGENWKKNIILFELYDKVYRVWKYLQQATSKDILSLPDIEHGHSTKEHESLTEEEVWLIGFCVARGSAQPQYQSGMYNSWNSNKKCIAQDLHKIKHWDIRNEDYRQSPGIEATWFVDPPYMWGGGTLYVL